MVSKEVAQAQQKKQFEANAAAKAKQDSTIASSKQSISDNRGYNYESRDRFGNIQGAKDGTPYSFDAQTGETSGNVPGRSPSPQRPAPRNISVQLFESLGFGDQTQAKQVSQNIIQSGNNQPTKRRSISVSLDENLGLSSGPPTGIEQRSTRAPPKVLERVKTDLDYIKPVGGVRVSSISGPQMSFYAPAPVRKLTRGQARAGQGKTQQSDIQVLESGIGKVNPRSDTFRESQSIKNNPVAIIDYTPKPILEKAVQVPRSTSPYGAAFISGADVVAKDQTIQNIIKGSTFSLKGEGQKIAQGKNKINVSNSDMRIIPGTLEYATSKNKQPLTLYNYERDLDPLNNKADLIQTVQRPVKNLAKYIIAAPEATKRIIQTGDLMAGQKYFDKEVGPKMQPTASSRLFSDWGALSDPKKLPENLISAATEISMYAFMGGGRIGQQSTPKGTNIFKNFKSETIKPGKGGGPEGGYATIKVKSPFSKSIGQSIREMGTRFKPTKSERTTFPVLAKPANVAPMFKPPKHTTWAVKGIKKQNEFQGIDRITIAKNMNTGERIALAGRSRNEFLNVKEIKKLNVGKPEEFVKGKDGNIDVKTFEKGHFRFEKIQKSGFEQYKMTDKTTGITQARTSINMNMGKPSKWWVQPRGKPSTSLNKIFELPKDAQVKDFKKFLNVERIKTNDDIFSGGPRRRNNQPGLMQRQAEVQKQKVDLKVDLGTVAKQGTTTKPSSFQSTKIDLGIGKSWFVPIKPTQRSYFGTPTKTKSKQNQIPGIGVIFSDNVSSKVTPKQSPKFDTFESSKSTTKQNERQGFFFGDAVDAKVTPAWPTPQDQGFPTTTPQRGSETGIPKGGGFFPYFPKISLGSWGFGDRGSIKTGYAAFGISSDINIKTLPTYSRYSGGTGIFKAQAKEDKRIQNLFYGKPKRSSSKKRSGRKKRK